ncbi:helix-turn-helix domain-containing protein, partial [Salmonella enterica]|uniref:helix-turn-helix domain-containing protein n=1 Tax=Salmonella enterica TaxID=28901 RepID=UPI003D270590
AARAGIGTTWVTWIEQGREVNPSAHTLDRLARGLALTPAERAYLFSLAGRHDPAQGGPQAAPEAIAAKRSAALARKVAASALCGNTDGRVRNRQPFLFSSSGSIAGA